MVRRRGLVRPRDLERVGLPTAVLYRLRDQGEVEQVGPAFSAIRTPQSRKSTPTRRRPSSSRVAWSACSLAFHEIGTQMPHEAWLALRAHSKRPTVSAVPLLIVWFSGDAFTEGVERHAVEGVEVSVYTPAKTIADLFKFRNKLGVDVSVEALRDAWARQLVTMEEILRFAKVCRMEKVMRPYLEAIIS
jgi:predicted transcriptional regulator of viral defense system